MVRLENKMEEGVIYIHNNIFTTLLAISEEEQMHGLMHQEWPPPVMSFVYAAPRVNKFWMKNTPSPLDIIFCADGRVKEICKGEPYSTAMVGGDQPTDLVIELPYGTVEAVGIKLWHKVGLVKPTVAELNGLICKKLGVYY